MLLSVLGSDRIGVRTGPSNKFGGMADRARDLTFPYGPRTLAPNGIAE